MGDQELVAALYPQLLPFRGQHYWFVVDRVLGMLATFQRDWERAAIHLDEAVTTARRENLRPEWAQGKLREASSYWVIHPIPI